MRITLTDQELASRSKRREINRARIEFKRKLVAIAYARKGKLSPPERALRKLARTELEAPHGRRIKGKQRDRAM